MLLKLSLSKNNFLKTALELVVPILAVEILLRRKLKQKRAITYKVLYLLCAASSLIYRMFDYSFF
jgi:hypothetical protein